MSTHARIATKPKTRLTGHQLDVLMNVVQGECKGVTIDLDRLVERIKRETTKESLQFTIRALIAYGMIEKLPQELRRGRMRVVFKATPLGEAVAGVRPVVARSFVEEDLGEILSGSLDP